MDVNGRRVLLTGATGGIGHAIARALAARGAQLVLTGRRTDVLEPLAAEVSGLAVAADLADPDAIGPLVDAAGEIDIVVANAALPASGAVLDFSVGEIDRALNVNLRAPIVLGRLYAERMLARGSGQLVFISSLAGKTAAPGSGVYSATKYGMRGFALGLREDLHGTGVGVSTVFPGFIRGAGMFAEADVELPKFVGTRTPEDVGAAVLRAIDRNPAEIEVAPLPVRLTATLAGALPGPMLAIQRRLGSQKVSAAMARGQRDKR